MLHEQRGVDGVAVGGGGARWCCFHSCDRRSAHQQSIPFEVVPPSPSSPDATAAPPAAARSSPLPSPAPALPLLPLHRPLPVHRRCRSRMHRRLPGLRRRRMHRHRVPPRWRSLERMQEDRRTPLNRLYRQRHPPIRLPCSPGILPWSPARHLVHRRHGHQRQHHGDGSTSRCSRLRPRRGTNRSRRMRRGT